MKSILLAVLVSTPAFADPAPRGPDFASQVRHRGVDRALAASPGVAPIDPEDSIAFAPGSAALGPAALTQLDAAAAWLRRHPGYQLAIEGQAGWLELAEARAAHVRAHLMSWGLASDRIVMLAGRTGAGAVLFASRRPVAELATAALDHRGGNVVATWTERGALLTESRTTVATRVRSAPGLAL
jgi:hypothetical protein